MTALDELNLRLSLGALLLLSVMQVSCVMLERVATPNPLGWFEVSNLVDPASSHMLVSKIKPCMSQYKLLYGETANGSLKQL